MASGTRVTVPSFRSGVNALDAMRCSVIGLCRSAAHGLAGVRVTVTVDAIAPGTCSRFPRSSRW